MIHVCSLARLEETVEQTGARHVVSLIGDEARLARPSCIVAKNHLWLRLHDISAPLDGYISGGGEPVDLVFSNSVLEHVDDVAGTVANLARVTARRGQNFHFIDLRDHVFKHPFEELPASPPRAPDAIALVQNLLEQRMKRTLEGLAIGLVLKLVAGKVEIMPPACSLPVEIAKVQQIIRPN